MAERRRAHRIDASANDESISSSAFKQSPGGTKKGRRIRRMKKGTSGKITLSVWSSRILLLVVAAMYSTNFASVKYLETLCLNPPCDHDPSEAAFCRFLVSACVCLPILYANRKYSEIIKAGFECGFWMTVNYICQAEALEYIPAGKCAFIAALAVAIVPLFAGFFLGKPIKPMSLVSALIALIGVAILENLIPIGLATNVASTAQSGGSGLFLGMGKGDILALGQPIGFGYGVMRIEHYVEKFSHVPNRVLTLTAAQCVTVCVLSFLWVLIDSGGKFPDLSYMFESHHIIALGWTGVVTTVVAIVLQGVALQKASATDASLIFSTEPVWGSLFAGWLLNESLTKTTYVGGAFILAACVIGSFTGTEDASTTKLRRDRFKAKSSDLSSDSLLPTTRVGLASNHNDSMTELSVDSLTDVRKFPTSLVVENGHAEMESRTRSYKRRGHGSS